MTAPLILVGDGWQNPTGLARIARDLHGVLADFQPVHVGFHPPGLLVQTSDRQLSFSAFADDYGASFVIDWILSRYQPHQPGVLFLVWDPSRVPTYLALARQHLPGWQVWGYFAVDGHTQYRTIGHEPGIVVRNVDRVLAYTQYGSQILSQVRGQRVPSLPHGHSIVKPPFFDHTAMTQYLPRLAYDPTAQVLGCVATNQPRKDLGLFVGLIAELRRRGRNVYGWLHTDVLQKAWNLPALVDLHGIGRWLRITTGALSDLQLQQLYMSCAATVCVGRGEGFGYPIVESQACGTRCLSMDYAGGAELTPKADRYPYLGVDATNQYAIGRPLADAAWIVARLEQVLDESYVERAAYCTGNVAHLHWDQIRGRWQEWVREGMEGL